MPQSPATAPRRAKDTSRKTRSGRIRKKTPQSGSSGDIRSRQSAPTRTEALPPDQKRNLPRPDILEKSGGNAQAAPQRRKRQRKTYQRERISRRLAGQLPEFGMLLGRGEAPPLYEAALRQPQNTRKASSSGEVQGGRTDAPAGTRTRTNEEGAGPQASLHTRQHEQPGLGARQPGARDRRLLKKPTAIRGARPQGISKSRQDGAGRPIVR